MAEPTYLALNCSLKADGPSSTERLLAEAGEALASHGSTGEIVRVAAHDVRTGVTADEGDGDAWPQIREQLLAADILLLGSPIWLGNPSSVCRRVLERCDAFLGETDDSGRMPTFGKVAAAVVTGNEDGAHNVVAQILQGLNDCGFTIPANSAVYWVGEAQGSVDYKDLEATPESVASVTQMMASNLMHLARMLRAQGYPPPA